LPDRNTAETDASSTVRDFKYSATIPTFKSFFVVPAIASQVSANLRIFPQNDPQSSGAATASLP
jgi:hypothetical protein